jgi:hypothetical protein
MRSNMKFKIIIPIFCFLLFSTAFAENNVVSVTVTGSAVGNPDKSSEMALADAMRNAVRKGAGVDVYSETKVSDFQTEYDQVLTSSVGYIKDYKILDQGYHSESNTYTVKISADVAKSAPHVDDIMALRLLVKRMDSPRLIVETKESIAGISESHISQSLLENIAKKTGFDLVSVKTVNNRNERDALRSDLLGENVMAKAKRAGITSVSDFKIIANVKGSVGKLRESFPDVYVRNTALSADLEAVWTDTGEVVAKVSVPTVSFKGEANLELPYDMPDQLVRYYLSNVLTGKEKASKNNNAYTLFRKVIAKWITELDLGYKVQIEIKGISKKDINKLESSLKAENGISYVWLREFDSRFYSIIEMQTFIQSKKLADIISKLLNGKYQIDVMTKRRLRFIQQSTGK